MQRAPPPVDQYLTWQDLLESDAEAPDAPRPSSASPCTEARLPEAEHGAVPAPNGLALPPDLQALLAEKERLEDELKRLTGAGAPRPEDERTKRMYPVRVHTVETRIEDRRLRKHDEHQRMLRQRALEARLVRAREHARQADMAAERRRRAIELALAKVREQLRQAEAAADLRRKAIERQLSLAREEERVAELAADLRRRVIEKARAQARDAERQAERDGERERQELVELLTETHWAAGRQQVLLKRAKARRDEKVWDEQSLHAVRERLIRLACERRAQHQDEVQEGQARRAQITEPFREARQQQRLDEAKREARSEDQRRVMIETRQRIREQEASREAPWQAQGDVQRYPLAADNQEARRLEVAQILYQRKQQTVDWEQERESLRERALQRRREERMLMQRFERRGGTEDRAGNAQYRAVPAMRGYLRYR